MLYGYDYKTLKKGAKDLFDYFKEKDFEVIIRDCETLNVSGFTLYIDNLEKIREIERFKDAPIVSVEDKIAIKEYAKKSIEEYFEIYHSCDDISNMGFYGIPYVIENHGALVQTMSINNGPNGEFQIYFYDSELKYFQKVSTNIIDIGEMEKFMIANFFVVKGLLATVLSAPSDCTNKGLSYYYNQLYICGDMVEDGLPIIDIKKLLVIDKKEGAGKVGEDYYYAKPACNPKKWYMNGGNFIYCRDTRFKFDYAIPIYDRVE